MKTGIRLITEERLRQIAEEGWTAEHDDQHVNSELLSAAVCYVDETHGDMSAQLTANVQGLWPWDDSWWKPEGPIRNLVKAGALIAAEIDRLQRLKS